MPKAKSREDRVNRAISIAQFFAEGGHTSKDAEEEFNIHSATIERDMKYLKESILCHAFSDNPQKEKQLILWYNAAKKNLKLNTIKKNKN